MRQWIILRGALAVTVGKGRISANLMAWQICLLRAGEDLHHCSSGRYQNTLSALSCFGCIDTNFEKCVFFFRNFRYFFLEQDSNVTASYRTKGSFSYIAEHRRRLLLPSYLCARRSVSRPSKTAVFYLLRIVELQFGTSIPWSTWINP